MLIALTSCVEPKLYSITIRVQPLPEYFIYTEDGATVAHIVEIDSCEYLILDSSTDMTRGIAIKEIVSIASNANMKTNSKK